MRLFVFDIDNTLLPRGEKNIPYEVIKAINKTIQNGDAVCFASGRPFLGIKQYLDKLIDGSKYAIVANGAALIDNNGNVLYEKTLKIDDLIYFRKKYKEHLCISVYGYDNNNGLLVFSKDKWVKHEIDVNKITHTYLVADNQLSKMDFDVYKIMIATDEDISHKILLSSKEKELFSASRSTSNYFEILSKGASKVEMVDKLVDILQVKTDSVYTFRDNENDVGMLKKYYGVAMGNAIDNCKQVSKMVTKDVKECGVVSAIEKIEQFQ